MYHSIVGEIKRNVCYASHTVASQIRNIIDYDCNQMKMDLNYSSYQQHSNFHSNRKCKNFRGQLQHLLVYILDTILANILFKYSIKQLYSDSNCMLQIVIAITFIRKLFNTFSLYYHFVFLAFIRTLIATLLVI